MSGFGFNKADALQNNQTIKASDLEIDASKALKKTAGELPKLDFNAQLGQYNSVKFDQSFQVSQTIPFPSLFGAKKELINAEIKGCVQRVRGDKGPQERVIGSRRG